MPKDRRHPRLYIIAGPNGAGKTTFAREFLPDAKCIEFINADLIATGLSPFSPESVALEAGRLMLERIHKLTELERDFAIETTLSGRTYVALIQQMRSRGYRVAMSFLWLPSPELSILRVADRVRKGGHHVPDDDVRRRYFRGIQNLFHLYRPLVDSWAIFDNSASVPRRIASKEQGVLTIYDSETFLILQQIAEAT